MSNEVLVATRLRNQERDLKGLTAKVAKRGREEREGASRSFAPCRRQPEANYALVLAAAPVLGGGGGAGRS